MNIEKNIKLNTKSIEEDWINLDCEPLLWGDIIEKHFLWEEGDILIYAKDLYVKDQYWKVVEISSDFSWLIYKYVW